MSQLLYHGDYIVVQGSLSEKDCEAFGEGRAYIHLTIIIQNNGKQRIISESLELEKNGSDWELKDWRAWYTIVNILSCLQYSLSDEPMTTFHTNHIVKDWLELLMRREWGVLKEYELKSSN